VQPGPELSASSLLLAAHKKVNLANKVEYQELYCEKPTAGGRGRKKTHIPGKIQQQIQEDKEEEKQVKTCYYFAHRLNLVNILQIIIIYLFICAIIITIIITTTIVCILYHSF
jgi:hypothetical protein